MKINMDFVNKSKKNKSPKGDKKLKPEKLGAKPGKTPVKKPVVPAEWLYMSENEISVSDIYQSLDPSVFSEVEVWREAGVLEISLGEKSSMDFEAVIPAQMDDDYGNAYLEEKMIRSLFMVTLKPESYQEAQNAMRMIISACGGFFCGDTEDFSPLVEQ